MRSASVIGMFASCALEHRLVDRIFLGTVGFTGVAWCCVIHEQTIPSLERLADRFRQSNKVTKFA